MAQQRAYYEIFRSDLIGIYIGGAIFILGIFLFAEYTQGWQWSLRSPSIWALIGWSVTAGGCVYWGVISAFRHRTRKFVAGNHIFELSHAAPIPLTMERFPINRDAVLQSSPFKEKDLNDAIGHPPGTNARGEAINPMAYEFGGVDAHGFHSLTGGQQGFLIVWGLWQVINLGLVGLFCPYNLDRVDHSKVDPKILAQLEEKRPATFKRNVTPIYMIASEHIEMRRWLENSLRTQSIVLQSIGLDNLTERFLSEFENQLFVSTNSGDLKKAWGRDPRWTMGQAFKQWLAKQPALTLALGRNEQDMESWRSTAFEYRSELTLTKAQLELKRGEVYAQDQTATATARRRVRTSGAPPSSGPAYDQASRAPGPSPYDQS